MVERLGLATVRDLLLYFPGDYIKYRRVKVYQLKVGDSVTVVGKIQHQEVVAQPQNSRLTIQTIIVKDKTGKIACKRFFNHPYYQSKKWRNEQATTYVAGGIVAIATALAVKTQSAIHSRSHLLGNQTDLGVCESDF
jgi:ATP-dependent DNA helicase RecG